jgi:hypothetical protein
MRLLLAGWLILLLRNPRSSFVGFHRDCARVFVEAHSIFVVLMTDQWTRGTDKEVPRSWLFQGVKADGTPVTLREHKDDKVCSEANRLALQRCPSAPVFCCRRAFAKSLSRIVAHPGTASLRTVRCSRCADSLCALRALQTIGAQAGIARTWPIMTTEVRSLLPVHPFPCWLSSLVRTRPLFARTAPLRFGC